MHGAVECQTKERKTGVQHGINCDYVQHLPERAVMTWNVAFVTLHRSAMGTQRTQSGHAQHMRGSVSAWAEMNGASEGDRKARILSMPSFTGFALG